MNIAGVIAEFNPLHLGHTHFLNEARRLTGAAGITVVMSGCFVQRGAPALTDKFERAAAAVDAGADIVLELPARCAVSSAEGFAAGGVEILERLGAVTDLVCGCETPDVSLIRRAAELLCDPPDAFRLRLRSGLAAGLSFPRAREDAVRALDPEAADLLRFPNNILAVEYEKAILRLGSRMRLVPVRRSGTGHSSSEIRNGGYASASAIRRALRQAEQDLPGENLSGETLRREAPALPVWEQLPESAPSRLPFRIYPDDASVLLHYALIRQNRESLMQYPDISADLASRILAQKNTPLPFDALADRICTRAFTRSRVCRALMRILLDLPESAASPVSAVRILALKKGSTIPRILSDGPDLALIAKAADASPGVLDEDIRAAEVYRSIVWQKTGIILPDDIRRHPVIV